MAGYTVSKVTSGKYARQVSVSASGPQGAQGPTGPSGPAGAIGPTGPKGDPGLSASYKYQNRLTAVDPEAGYLAFNEADVTAATELYISETDALTDRQLGLLNTITQSTNSYKSVITLLSAEDSRQFSRYYVRSVVDNGGWRTFDLVHIDSTISSWVYNQNLVFMVDPIGDAGNVQSLGDLGDVDVNTPIQGDVLAYDPENDEWVNKHSTQLSISGQNISGTIEGGSASTF